MGLHNTAHYLKTKGRGTDTELVHMSKNELKGLQQLAMAHGGSLSINPNTGLAEAGFLEQVLPVVAAAAATYFTAGAAAPALGTALGIGSTASGILAGAGAGALISGGTAALQGKDAGKAALMGGLGGAIAGGVGAYGPTDAATGAAATQQAAIEGGTQALGPISTPASTGIDPALLEGMSKEQVLAQTGPQTVTPQQLSQGVAQGTYTPAQATQYGQAYTNAYANAPQPTFYQGLEPNGIGRMGVQALPALGLMEDKPLNPVQPEQYDPNNPMRWRLSSNFQAPGPVRPNPYYKATYADGGIIGMNPGGPVEARSNQITGGNNTMFPQSQQEHTQFATPSQMPTSAEVVASDYDAKTNAYTGMPTQRFDGGGIAELQKLPKGDPGIFYDSDANTKGLGALGATQYQLKKLGKKFNVPLAANIKSGIKDLGGDMSDNAAAGGTASLGGYSDGGRMLKGPGDGMSDSIPASIGGKQPARLADGEFVVPADVVSHLGNGSTDAGAKKLYGMMDKIRKARTGKKKQAPAVKADKFLP